MTAPQHPPLKSVEVNRSLLIFIVVSIALHSLIIAVLSKSTMDATTPNVTEPETIRARIVYPTLPEAVIKESEYDKAEVESADATEKALSEEVEQTSTAAEKTTQLREPEPSAQPIPTTQTRTQEDLPAVDNGSPSQRSPRSTSTRDMLNRHLGQLHSQQQIQTAREASQGYQQQKTSPDLNIPAYQEPSNEPVVKQKIVACDNTTVNILRMVSQIAGGTLRCREESDIDTFINKRIEKKQ
ncbi:hypothetical protein [Alteromonas facilis]|uniref:hypothetical protein n=1 Tax=Alteromonas facilis TaxID=2048004 RepID=UPI000F5D49DE|nr:hypothetical protein [Alteromonas facilis]